MVTLGDFRFNPPPESIRVRVKKLIGTSALIGRTFDAFYPLGMEVKEITLEGVFVNQQYYNLGDKTARQQEAQIYDFLRGAAVLTFTSDVTGAIDVVIADFRVKYERGSLGLRYTLKLIEKVS